MTASLFAWLLPPRFSLGQTLTDDAGSRSLPWTVGTLCSPAGQEEFFQEVGVPVAHRTEAPPALDDAATSAFIAKAIALAPKYRTELLLGEPKP
jgi:hypothetical protein